MLERNTMFESVKSLSFLTSDRVIYKETLQRWRRMEMFVTIVLKGNIKETTFYETNLSAVSV